MSTIKSFFGSKNKVSNETTLTKETFIAYCLFLLLLCAIFYYVNRTRYNNEKKQLVFQQTLNDFDKEMKLPYHLAFGTALGLIRDKQFIPWDHDIDVVVFRKDLDERQQDILKTMQLKTFDVSHVYGTIDDGFEISFVHKVYKVPLDIFVFYESKKNFYWYSVYNDNKQIRYKVPKYKPIQYHSTSYKIMPSSVFRYLYNDTWQKPIRSSFLQDITTDKGILYRTDTDIPIPSENFITTFFHSFTIPKNSRKISSHLHVIKEIVEKEYDWSLILEKDVILSNGVTQKTFGEAMLECTSGLRDPKIVYFGYFNRKSVKRLPKMFNSEIAIVNDYAESTHAYALSLEGARRLFQTFESSLVAPTFQESVRKTFLQSEISLVLYESSQNKEYYGEGIVLQYNK